MPTPVGHVLGGMFSLAILKINVKKQIGISLIALLAAGLPDIDFLFGLVRGDANLYHHQFTHSLVFVVSIGLVFAAVMSKAKVMQFFNSFVLITVCGASHLILDLLALDTSEPFGMPLLWPFSGTYYISPMTIFSDVHRSGDAHSFFISLFNSHNLQTVLIEIAILVPLTLFAVLVSRKKLMNK